MTKFWFWGWKVLHRFGETSRRKYRKSCKIPSQSKQYQNVRGYLKLFLSVLCETACFLKWKILCEALVWWLKYFLNIRPQSGFSISTYFTVFPPPTLGLDRICYFFKAYALLSLSAVFTSLCNQYIVYIHLWRCAYTRAYKIRSSFERFLLLEKELIIYGEILQTRTGRRDISGFHLL